MMSIPKEERFFPLCPIVVVFQLRKHPIILWDTNFRGLPEVSFSLSATPPATGKTERFLQNMERVFIVD
jgi:hypothetical protein